MPVVVADAATAPIVVAEIADAAVDAGPPPDPAVYGPNTGLVALRRAQVCPGDATLTAGYSKDGRFFYSWSDLGTNVGSSPWQFIETSTNKVTKHRFRPPPNAEPLTGPFEAAVKRYDDEHAAFLKSNPVAPCELRWTGPAWPHRDIEFWAQSSTKYRTDTSSPKATLEFGARVNGGSPVVVHTFDFSEDAVDFEPDSLAIHCASLRPDGKELGVIAVGCGSHFYVQLLPFRMKADEFVKRVRVN